MERKFEIMDALGDVNTSFVAESIPNSPQMKDSFKARLSTIAASFAFVTVIGVLALLTSRLGFASAPSGGITPGAHGGDVYGTEEVTEVVTGAEKTDAPENMPFRAGILLSEMSDEELIAVADAVTGETRYDIYGTEYRYGLFNVVYERFWVYDNEEEAKKALAGALREAAACDEAAADMSFLDDIAGVLNLGYAVDDINGDDVIDAAIDAVMYDRNSFFPVSELGAVLDIVVMRYYIEYYDSYAGGDVITPERIATFASALSAADERFEYGTRDHLWPARIFEPVIAPAGTQIK